MKATFRLYFLILFKVSWLFSTSSYYNLVLALDVSGRVKLIDSDALDYISLSQNSVNHQNRKSH